MNEWVWSNGGMILTGENWSTGRKAHPSVTNRLSCVQSVPYRERYVSITITNRWLPCRGMIDYVLRIIRNTQTVWAEYIAFGFSSIKFRCFVRFKVDGFNSCYLLCLFSMQIFHNYLFYHYHYRHFVTNVSYRDKGRALAYSGLSPFMSLSG